MHHHPGVSIMDFTSGRSSGNETSNVVKESLHVYEVMLRKDKRGVDLISDALAIRSALETRYNRF